MNRNEIIGLCNSVIMVAEKFIGRVETERIISPETLTDLIKLKAEAEIIKGKLISNR